MSDSFEEQLERASALASGRARLRGPAEIRARGNQRKRRRRAAQGTLGVAVVAAAVALGTTLPGGPPTHQRPVATSTRTSPSPTTTTAAPPTGTTAMPTGGGGDSAGTIGSSTTTTTTTTTPSAAPPDPGRYVPNAWLAANQEPFGDRVPWAHGTSPLGSLVGGEVYEDTNNTEASGLSMFGCSGAGFAGSLVAAQHQSVEAGGSTSSQDGLNANATATFADQGIYFYPDAASASDAWNYLASAWTACAQSQANVNTRTGQHQVGTIEQTVVQPTAQCLSDLSQVPDAQGGASNLYHVCYAIRGQLIEWVSVTAALRVNSFSGLDVASTDSATLANINQSLAVYGG